MAIEIEIARKTLVEREREFLKFEFWRNVERLKEGEWSGWRNVVF
jgi:hypothetical protein